MNAEFSVEPKEIVGEGPLLYGDFMMPNTDNKNYEEITDMEKVTVRVHTVHLGNNFIVDSSYENGILLISMWYKMIPMKILDFSIFCIQLLSHHVCIHCSEKAQYGSHHINCSHVASTV